MRHLEVLVEERSMQGFLERKRHRDPEGIDGCLEATRDLLNRHGYAFNKVELAARMGRRMAERPTHESNTSSSFRHFLTGLAHLTSPREAA